MYPYARVADFHRINEGTQDMGDTRGYEIEDKAGLTLAMLQEAVEDHGEDFDYYCDSEHDGWVCTRMVRHTGPHLAASSDNGIAAVWEDAA